jgi:hypothetical protein
MSVLADNGFVRGDIIAHTFSTWSSVLDVSDAFVASIVALKIFQRISGVSGKVARSEDRSS